MDERRWLRCRRAATRTGVGLLAALVAATGCATSSDAVGDRAGSTTTPQSGPVITTAPSARPPATTSTTGATSGERDPAAALVDRLVVAEPDPGVAPYRRAAFGDDWDYDPASGCNTRERVLIEESLIPPVVDDRCRSTGGQWTSTYDGVTVTDVADLQIDHLVPLADAWRSGAATWTDERRFAFANDLTDPATLVAVTGSTNQSKSDSAPDRWLPPDRSAWCTYATDWVAVKATWQLTVTPAEKATLVQVLAGC